MGGKGSGNWYRLKPKKRTVETSLVVTMQELRRRQYQGASGTFTWIRGDGSQSSVGYTVAWNREPPTITLDYRWASAQDVRIPVQLASTPLHFGGKRWWFICPLILENVPCNRRADKLYLPPHERYFGCRKCHDLTYQCCQESHKCERLFVRLGLDAEDGKLFGSRRAWKAIM